MHLSFLHFNFFSFLSFLTAYSISEVKRRCLVASDSSRPRGLQPTRLLHPWDSPGKNTGVGCHFLLHIVCSSSIFFEIYFLFLSLFLSFFLQFSSVAQLCLTLCDPMNLRMPGLAVHHRLLEFTQTQIHRVGDAIQLSHPLSSPSPPAPNPSQHQSLFQ